MALRVLITNNSLGQPGGSETYTLEICKHLTIRGHHPIAYSTVQGRTASELRKIGVSTVDRLEDIPPPDIIHGHHHLDTTYACLLFPQTPCLHFCHGISPWEELPAAKLRNIIYYVAISERTKNHFTANGIPEEKIEIIRNFVDNTRFTPFPDNSENHNATSETPFESRKRALIYGNYTIMHASIIKDACHRAGYTLDTIGMPWGNNTSSPETVLPKYDIIFCYGKSALESLYVGSHVILNGSGGTGPLINSLNFEQLRTMNFGFTTCLDKPDTGSLERFLKQVSKARECGEKPITSQQRDSLSADHAIDRIIGMYYRAIAEFNPTASEHQFDGAERRALAKYLHFLQKSRHNQGIDFTPAESAKLIHANRENEQLNNSRHNLEINLKTVRAELAQAKNIIKRQEIKLSEAQESNTRLQDNHAELTNRLTQVCSKLEWNRSALRASLNVLKGNNRRIKRLQEMVSRLQSLSLLKLNFLTGGNFRANSR